MKRNLVAVVVAVLAAVGAWMVWAGLSSSDEAAPEPEPFSAAASPSSSPPAPSLKPRRFAIPALNIEAPFHAGKVTTEGLQIPSDPHQLTVWAGGGTPCGTEGTVLLAGHVISYGDRGALWDLHKVTAGTIAYLSCSDGSVTSWYATQAVTLNKADLPGDVFNTAGERRLAVVTCGGPVLSNGHYRDNVIVYFSPLATPAAR